MLSKAFTTEKDHVYLRTIRDNLGLNLGQSRTQDARLSLYDSFFSTLETSILFFAVYYGSDLHCYTKGS